LLGLPTLLVADPPQLSLPRQTAAPGSSTIFPVVFDSKSTIISGVQFDIQYDNSAMSLTAVLGDAARSSSKLLYQLDLAPNKRRFLMVGLNANPLAAGALINLFVNLNTGVSQGVFSLSFSNIVGTDPYGVLSSVVGLDGSVTLQGTTGRSVLLQTAGVLNGASIAPGPIAPGEFFTLLGSSIGPISTTTPVASESAVVLGGTSVLFDGIPAPLTYAAPNQINGVVPYELSGSGVTNLQIATVSRVISNLTIPVLSASPSIFTLDGSGVGQGAILNQDSSVNSPSNPAGKGTVVALFATGAGQTDPPGVDGQIARVLAKPIVPVSVKIDGLDAEVLYAGAAPGLIAGVLQVNVRIPPTAASGFSVPIILAVGAVIGPPGVTLAVQ
jgi:uncharacterized protein (TIGR03437 family)